MPRGPQVSDLTSTRESSHGVRGFTMLEVVLVLVMISIMLMTVAPSLRGWGRGAKLRDASQQFVAAARWARAEAAATATIHRIELETQSNQYVVSRQGPDAVFSAVPGELGQPTILPAGFRLEMASGGIDGRAINFYPNGRTSPAVVRIVSPDGGAVTIACEFPADLFRSSLGAIR